MTDTGFCFIESFLDHVILVGSTETEVTVGLPDFVIHALEGGFIKNVIAVPENDVISRGLVHTSVSGADGAAAADSETMA